VLSAAGDIEYIIHRVEDVSAFVRLHQYQREQEQVSQALRSQAERMEAEIYQRAQKVAEANRQLQQTNHELSRARDLADEARGVADRANQGKSRFLATASHDLRQPLQTLALLNGTLRRSVTDQAAAEALLQQDRSIGSMSRLLNALLDMSKLESGAIKPEPTDFTVATLFQELRSEFESMATHKGLQLIVEDCEYQGHCDPSLVEQILRNLVSNAIKYTREGWVRLRCLYEAPLIRIEVLDTGIGIPPDQIPYIYDEFYQVGVASNSSRDGYGLGLTVVQRLVKLLTLKLDVRSELGQRSTFSLVLPAGRG
jgi:two-component system CheB/CheR fusion protein